jgi:3-deoxy-manno-octulosonate cytidylyltransferase (CMP-KDO synthetase)
MSKIYIVIPARYASTRLPGKPLRLIAEKPMLWHTYQRACEAQADGVVIATDDPRIKEACENFGASVCMTSPSHPSGTDRLAEVAVACGWAADDTVVNLQGDEPLMPPHLLTQVARQLREHPDASVATLCVPAQPEEFFNPNAVKVVFDQRGYALYFSRAPIPWHRDLFARDQAGYGAALYRHLGIYAYRVEFLLRYPTLAMAPVEHAEALEQLRVLWHGERIHVEVANAVPGPGVDTEEDLLKVDALMRAHR